MIAPQPQGPTSISATEAKNDFGSLLDKVISGKTVVITKHDVPKAVMISMEQFESLSAPQRIKMGGLRAEFDAMLQRMQTPESKAAMRAAFNATPEEMGKAAVAAARNRAR